MAAWGSNSKKPLKPNEIVQNCDLPPPAEVFAGPEKAILSSKDRINLVHEVDRENGKLELLKALRLSQTRAREAEKRAEALAKERDSLAEAFLKESRLLSAYRWWVKLLDLRLSRLQRQISGRPNEEEDGEDGGGEFNWFVAVAVCFGIAGLGFASGYRLWF
ncbi:uncharacterized protein LOC127799865 [Diospyros lotus]|uniref:uncharacterized protein LOC127799865 n=1 Tax=Diospyros lotus TaxID=55363 RepID=UPI002256F406|nr:uncharacterized protein LOC127799865 [Diospyros lotus]